jgi:TolB-like protein
LSLFNELKRRNVLRVGAAYLVTAWLIIQVIETLFPIFGFSNDLIRLVVLSLAIGLLPALVFAWVFEVTPSGLKREKDIDRKQSITSTTGKNLDRIVIFLLTICLALLAFDKFILDPSRDATMVEAATRDAVQSLRNQTPEKSIAVLPFVSMSADPEQEYFSDGITEEILNSLAQIKGLKVTGRTSSFAFKGRNKDLREIGEFLNVAHVLEGSVRRAGNRIRITAQLIKVDDGYHLWSETFERELIDVFAIQDEIAIAIVNKLRLQFLGDGSQTIVSRQTDIEAYELYLQARQLIYERRQKSIELAAQLLERAISLDRNYAPAHAQLGIALLLLDERNYGDILHESARELAKEQLDTALRLDPNLAEAWAGLGLYHSRSSTLAIKALETALSINPNLLDALHWLHNARSEQGNDLENLARIEKILEMDPLYTPAFSNAVTAYNWSGQPEKAWALLERVKPLLGNQFEFRMGKIYTHFYSGQYALGLPIAEALIKQEPNRRILREMLCFAWNSTHQFDRTIDLSHGHPAIIANWQQGLVEEALDMAYEPAASGLYYEPYFQVLNASGNSKKLIDFLESRWPDLNSFANSFPFNSDIMGYAPLNEIALAYMRVGEFEKAQEALALVHDGHEQLQTNGRNNIQFSMNRAVYYALTGERDTALIHLAASIDGGYIGSSRLTRLWPAFESLEGDPRYEAIQASMIKHLNEERETLGLGPVHGE